MVVCCFQLRVGRVNKSEKRIAEFDGEMQSLELQTGLNSVLARCMLVRLARQRLELESNRVTSVFRASTQVRKQLLLTRDDIHINFPV